MIDIKNKKKGKFHVKRIFLRFTAARMQQIV